MNGDLVPAFAAAGGGSLLLGGIVAYERKRDREMKASRERLSLRFPARLEPLRALAALDGLSGLLYTNELICETVARPGLTEHAIWVPKAVGASLVSTLTGVIPSLRLTETPVASPEAVTIALRLFVPTPSLLATEQAVETSRSLLAGLADVGESEQIVIRFALRPGTPRRPRRADSPDRPARELERAWQKKATQAGFSVAGLVLVRAASTDLEARLGPTGATQSPYGQDDPTGS